MKKLFVSKCVEPLNNRIAAWGLPFAIIGLLLLLLGAANLELTPTKARTRQPRMSTTVAGPSQSARGGGNFHRGHWQADVRTLLAVVHFLMEPETPIKTARTVLPDVIRSLSRLTHK